MHASVSGYRLLYMMCISVQTHVFIVVAGDIPFKVFRALGDGIIKIEESEIKR